MISAAHVEHVYAQRHIALRRFATAPELCDRHSCSGIDIWGGTVVYLAGGARSDYMVVVFPTRKDAMRIARVSGPVAVRRQNVLLLYLRSAAARLTAVRRIFSSL